MQVAPCRPSAIPCLTWHPGHGTQACLVNLERHNHRDRYSDRCRLPWARHSRLVSAETCVCSLCLPVGQPEVVTACLCQVFFSPEKAGSMSGRGTPRHSSDLAVCERDIIEIPPWGSLVHRILRLLPALVRGAVTPAA